MILGDGSVYWDSLEDTGTECPSDVLIQLVQKGTLPQSHTLDLVVICGRSLQPRFFPDTSVSYRNYRLIDINAFPLSVGGSI